MPYTRTETYTTTGAKPSWNADESIAPFNLSVACILSAGTTSYKLQYTLDDFSSASMTDASATWFDSSDIPAGTTATAQASFVTPVTRFRINIASLSGGTLTMKSVQGLSTN